MVLGTKKETVVHLIKRLGDMRKDCALPVHDPAINKNVVETFCKRNGFIVTKLSHDFQFHRSATCSSSCVGPSVLDILARKPYLFTFKEACEILTHCDLSKHLPFVSRVLADYAILIHGLPQCAEEDLYLAVFFFIEEVFGIKSNLELCVKYKENDGTELIGVVFDSMFTRREVLRKDYLLEDIDIEVEPNYDINWIVDGFCAE